MAKDQNVEEQALSKAAEVAFESQLEASDSLDVDIDAEASEVVQGELRSVTVEGKGLEMKKDLRAEDIKVATNQIAINPMQAAFGNIELKHPTDAEAEVMLTEADLERAFNSDFIGRKLKGMKLDIDGNSRTIDPNHINFKLPGDGKVSLSAEFLIIETVEKQTVSITAVPQVGNNGHSIVLKDVESEGPKSVVDALLNSATELLDLRNFELEGMSFRLQQLEVQAGQMTMKAVAQVSSI